MKELQAICDNMPIDSISHPPAAIAEVLESGHCKLTSASDINVSRGALQVFENGPRKHQW